MTEDTQAVVDKTNVSATPETKVDNAPDKADDLDTLLTQYEDEQTQKVEQPRTDPAPKAGAGHDPNVLAEQVKSLTSAQFKRDMNDVIGKVRGELDAKLFDDDIVEAWINTKAIKDVRLQRAWSERLTNPSGFQKVVQGLSRDFTKQYGRLPDANATEDRAAVAAAVRGASTKAPEGKPPTFAGKSNNEYADEVEKNYGYRPAV